MVFRETILGQMFFQKNPFHDLTIRDNFPGFVHVHSFILGGYFPSNPAYQDVWMTPHILHVPKPPSSPVKGRHPMMIAGDISGLFFLGQNHGNHLTSDLKVIAPHSFVTSGGERFYPCLYRDSCGGLVMGICSVDQPTGSKRVPAFLFLQ